MYNDPIQTEENPSITIRLAAEGEEAALERLAALDSRRLPEAPLLVALVGSEARAAISLTGGEAIADPFKPTEELVSMLRIRLEELRGHGGRRHRDRLPGGLARRLIPG